MNALVGYWNIETSLLLSRKLQFFWRSTAINRVVGASKLDKLFHFLQFQRVLESYRRKRSAFTFWEHLLLLFSKGFISMSKYTVTEVVSNLFNNIMIGTLKIAECIYVLIQLLVFIYLESAVFGMLGYLRNPTK